MPARPTRPALQQRYDRRRQEIVFTAAREFSRHGYDQTTMHELARSMGLATGALYHYFSSKEQLLMAICDQLTEPLVERAREIVTSDASPRETLQTLVRVWVSNVIEHRDHMLVFQQERHVIESGVQWRRVRESRKAFERLVEQAIDAAGATGRPRLSTRLALVSLLGMVNHTAQWYKPRGHFSPEDVADGYLALLLAEPEPDAGRASHQPSTVSLTFGDRG